MNECLGIETAATLTSMTSVLMTPASTVNISLMIKEVVIRAVAVVTKPVEDISTMIEWMITQILNGRQRGAKIPLQLSIIDSIDREQNIIS